MDNRGTEEMIIYGELETMVENLVRNYSNIMYPYLLGSIEENYKYLCQVKQSLSQDLALISLEYNSVNCQSLCRLTFMLYFMGQSKMFPILCSLMQETNIKS